MTDPVEDSVARLSSAEQCRLAVRIAGIVSAYGVIAPEVIDPALFEAMIRDLLHAHQAADGPRLERVRAECERIIDLFRDDEPDGNGFYAFAAVVAVHYAADAVLEDPAMAS